MFLRLEPGPSACTGHQLSFLGVLDAATPLHLGAGPPTPAMLRVLALAALRPDGEVRPGSLSPGAYYALCAAMATRGLVRVEAGAVTITVAGRVAVTEAVALASSLVAAGHSHQVVAAGRNVSVLPPATFLAFAASARS